MITLCFKSVPTDFEIYLDDQQVPYQQDHSRISVQVATGFHQLSITNLGHQQLEIDQVWLDDCNCRELIYTSYVTDQQGQRSQPCLTMWQSGLTWTLPLIYPLSLWITSTNRKINYSLLGQDLFDQYVHYYPQKIQLDRAKFPRVVCDFFSQDYDYTVVPKNINNPDAIPFMRYNRPIDDDLLQAVRTEIISNKQRFTPTLPQPGNATEFGKNPADTWRVLWIYKKKPSIDILQSFPNIQRLAESLDLDVYHIFVGWLSPGQFIWPHVDDLSLLVTRTQPFERYHGCTQLYIPLEWPAGCHIKFANAGLIPLDRSPWVINNDHFTHSAVNDSDQDRFVLGFRASHDILDHCVFDHK